MSQKQTRFEVGQMVVALVDGRDLRKGEQYEVRAVDAQTYPWGTFVEYVLGPVGSQVKFRVANGHLLLDEVRDAAGRGAS